MTPTVSVVIPTQDRLGMLREVLGCLDRQDFPLEKLQVIVVDDGSEDGTAGYLTSLHPSFQLVYEHIPRTGAFCPARPRNVGLSLATGDLVLFMDSDVLAGRHFVAAHASAHRNGGSREQAVIGYTCGYASRMLTSDCVREQFTASRLAMRVEQLTTRRSGLWRDAREGVYQATADLDEHEAPWQYFWTNNVSVSRRLATEIGGFDESFCGWGGEDIEFAYRLWLQGARFSVVRDACGIHCPHASGPPGVREQQLARNRRRLVAKHASPQLEFTLWAGREASWAWERVAPLTRQSAPPEWSRPHHAALRRSLRAALAPGARAVVYGPAGSSSEIATACTPFTSLAGSGALPLLGVFTPWGDQQHAAVLIWDYWRWVPAPVLRGIVREGARIAVDLYLLDSGVTPPDAAVAPSRRAEEYQQAIHGLGTGFECRLLEGLAVGGYHVRSPNAPLQRSLTCGNQSQPANLGAG